jgi:RND family efflux transporter MFP subunit
MKSNIIIASIASLFLVACGSPEQLEISTQTAIAVQVAKPIVNTQSSFVLASGKVEAKNSANLSTRMMGFVKNVAVKVGQKVNKGQLLISVNNTDLRAKKAQVDASILQAESAFSNAQKDYERFKTLFAQKSASQKDLDDMTTRYEMAKAGYEAAQQMRNEVNAQFAYAEIRAPFAGVVTNTFIKSGDMANPGMPLVSIEGAGNLQIMAMVSESDIASITQGMSVNARIKSLNKDVQGSVIEISRSAKNTGGQFLVKIHLDKTDPSVLSGMFASVQFITENKPNEATPTKVMLPKTALVHQGQLSGVYTVGSSNTAILRWLRLGKTIDNNVEVLSGLTANEAYIVKAKGKLYNGAAVQIGK